MLLMSGLSRLGVSAVRPCSRWAGVRMACAALALSVACLALGGGSRAVAVVAHDSQALLSSTLLAVG